MRFLAIVQDLRVSGTSEGIVSRSFLAKLRTSYPDSIIDVVYIKNYEREDRLDLLPVNKMESHLINTKIPFFVKFLNRFYWRIFHESLNDNYVLKQYAKVIAKINYQQYDHIFVRSAGNDHEMIMATHNLPILQKAIVNFHDPYPLAWYVGTKAKVSNLELFRLKRIMEIVEQAKTCSSSASYMSHDLQQLYASKKKFHTLPHQFDSSVFDLNHSNSAFVKNKKVTISYHGAIQFGRNLDELLDVYCEILHVNTVLKENTEFFVRCKSSEYSRIKEKYRWCQNIYILESVGFQTSYYEQAVVSDINIALENGPIYCSILLGKAPLLDFVNKRFFCVSPIRSEMRDFIKFEKYIATYKNKVEIKQKFNALINEVLNDVPFKDKICGDYFSDENFKKQLDCILNDEAVEYKSIK